jgi:hypothetical protein
MNTLLSLGRGSGLINVEGNELVHYSAPYLEFLRGCLPGASIQVLEHRTDGEVDGILPVAILRHSEYGTVINSLPFFGSHGGPFAADSSSGIRDALLRDLIDLAEELDAASSTLIENPFHPLNDGEIAVSRHTFTEDRIGQLTALPAGGDFEAALFDTFHMKTRNAVRKGLKLSLAVERREDEAAWQWMQGVHEKSISSKGGLHKSMVVFDTLRRSFGSYASLHIGSVAGQPVCGLVSIRYRNTLEYFTPVIDEKWKESQALSALIFCRMTEAAREGCNLWNWGGTRRSQEGVYRFKNRWGAFDRPYRYFNWVRKPEILTVPVLTLQQAFPYFYIYKY